jgi:hypothetical protein
MAVRPVATISDAQVAEGVSGLTPVTLTVSLPFRPIAPVTINWATVDGTATAPADYIAASGTVTIVSPAGSATIVVQVVGDNASESNETFTVVLSAPVNATLGKSVGTVTILADEPGTNPLPVLAAIDPSSAPAGSPGFTLVATGSSFIASSVVHWNGAPRPTTFISATELRADIPAGDLVTAGTALVSVSTPGPGGGLSAERPFTIAGPAVVTQLSYLPGTVLNAPLD